VTLSLVRGRRDRGKPKTALAWHHRDSLQHSLSREAFPSDASIRRDPGRVIRTLRIRILGLVTIAERLEVERVHLADQIDIFPTVESP